VGVILDNGEPSGQICRPPAVNPKLLYTRLLPADALPSGLPRSHQELAQRLRHLRMNVALNALPRSPALPGRGVDHLSAGIINRPEPWVYGSRLAGRPNPRWSREPVIEVLIPSTLDDTLCRPRKHVASLFCQHVAPQLARWPIMGRSSR